MYTAYMNEHTHTVYIIYKYILDMVQQMYVHNRYSADKNIP